jgi:hypothetical protein
MLESLRQPAWIIMGLTTPLLYLGLFTPLLNSLAGGPGFPPGHVLDVFVPGILVLIAFGAGMGTGWPVIWELDSGVIERLRVLGHLNPMYYAVQAARDLAADSVGAQAVGIGFAVTGAAAGLALYWGTRAYQRAMALSPRGLRPLGPPNPCPGCCLSVRQAAPRRALILRGPCGLLSRAPDWRGQSA